MNTLSNTTRKHACDYSSSYAAIYDSSYGAGFVFVDEDELYSEDSNCNYIPSLPDLGFLKRQKGCKILQVIIAKA